MKKNVQDIPVNVDAGKSQNEKRMLNSCVSAYFKSKLGSSPLKEQDASIRSVLKIYFQCRGK
jgi:hypothetical protein